MITKSRVGIETKRTENISETKSEFLKETNEMDKFLSTLTKKKRVLKLRKLI